jgi:hypothetical protein
MGKLLQLALTAIRNWLTKASPAALAAIGKRIGVQGALTAEKVLTMAKDNKVMTSLILFEMGKEGAELLQQIRTADPDVDNMIGLFGRTNDVVTDDLQLSNIGQFKDEFEVLSSAIRHHGGLERFMNARRAMAMDESVIRLYLQVREISFNF